MSLVLLDQDPHDWLRFEFTLNPNEKGVTPKLTSPDMGMGQN